MTEIPLNLTPIALEGNIQKKTLLLQYLRGHIPNFRFITLTMNKILAEKVEITH